MNDLEIKDKIEDIPLATAEGLLIDCENIIALGFLDLWSYLSEKYGHYHLLERYYQNGLLMYFPVKEALNSLFLANAFKYKHLLDSLNDYNPLDPYHIVEEHATGNKVSANTSTPQGTTITKDYETSYDDTVNANLSGKTETSYDNYSVKNSFENNVSESFQDKTMENLSTSEKKYVSRVGNIGNHAITDLLDKERRSVMFTLWDVICKDITDMLCYKIFW